MTSTSTDLMSGCRTPPRSSPPGVFVLGMARSGTSAITRMITLQGLSLCVERDLIGPRHYNRQGLFESRTLQVFNHTLLLRWARDGWREPRLPSGWERERAVRFLERHARRLFVSLHPVQPWVYKDSSLNMLLPFWTRALRRAPDIVLIYRHPAAVARSLQRDAGIDFARGLEIWESHNRAALHAIEGRAVLLVDYDELVSNPRATARSLAAWLRSRGYAVPDGAEEASAATINGHERHWTAGSQDDAALSPGQRGLLAGLDGHRGPHAAWSGLELRPPAQAPQPIADRFRVWLRRPRWWWWMAELIMPAPIGRAAQRLPSPRRWRAQARR